MADKLDKTSSVWKKKGGVEEEEEHQSANESVNVKNGSLILYIQEEKCKLKG